MANLGANIGKDTVCKVSKCLGPLDEFLTNFHHTTCSQYEESECHSKPPQSDINLMLTQLLEAKTFDRDNCRALHTKHTHIPPFHAESKQIFTAWLLATAKAAVVF